MIRTDQQIKILWAQGEAKRPLVWKWEICERCHGGGKHANSAFNGMSVGELYDDLGAEEGREFLDELCRRDGMYSVKCEVGEECQAGKIWVPAEENLTPEETQELEKYMMEVWECEQESEAERRAGC